MSTTVITEQIASRLNQVETEHAVRILYAVESGSRAWGFASEDSDYDVRFLYVREARDYLCVTPPRDVIEQPVDATWDVNGWDLFKALNLFRASNPPLLEWLYSPIIYRETGDFAARLRALAQSHFSPRRMTYHYLSMAQKNFKLNIGDKTQVSLKKYLYVLRPLVCIRWIEQRNAPPPTCLQETMAGIELAHEIREKLSEIIERKQTQGELGTGPPDGALNAFILQEAERIEGLVATLPDAPMEPRALNELAWSVLGL